MITLSIFNFVLFTIIVLGVLLDMEKAFDAVNHENLSINT